MKKFSEILEELRRTRQLSKKELAVLADLTPGYISLLTRGGREAPSEDTLKALAMALNLDAETELHAIIGTAEVRVQSIADL